MHIHILGICGTFMAGIAVLAKQLGYTVTGSDANVYPPMSTQLETLGIQCYSGYAAEHMQPAPDYVVIGNALSRGNPAVEYVLNQGLNYISGPQWLAEHILAKKWVIAIAGTHGKTTTASMVAWILEYAQLSPSFLIGGIPQNFGISARFTESRYFVVEADEYDAAFFDKRSKFVHYHPRTAVINNLEFDHADIFSDLAAIQKQFHHLIRTIPSQGLIIHAPQPSILTVLQQGCWTPCETFGDTESHWQAKPLSPDCSQFEVWYQAQKQGEVLWTLIGQHNMDNALAAIASSHHVGVSVAQACQALNQFHNVKRRLELRGVVKGIHVYDDFAHHPTAIATTLAGLRQRVGTQKIVAVLEPRSNSMRMGIYQNDLAAALSTADTVLLYQPEQLHWSLTKVAEALPDAKIYQNIEALIKFLVNITENPAHILIMSNGDFQNLHQRLLNTLTSSEQKFTSINELT